MSAKKSPSPRKFDDDLLLPQEFKKCATITTPTQPSTGVTRSGKPLTVVTEGCDGVGVGSAVTFETPPSSQRNMKQGSSSPARSPSHPFGMPPGSLQKDFLNKSVSPLQARIRQEILWADDGEGEYVPQSHSQSPGSSSAASSSLSKDVSPLRRRMRQDILKYGESPRQMGSSNEQSRRKRLMKNKHWISSHNNRSTAKNFKNQYSNSSSPKQTREWDANLASTPASLKSESCVSLPETTMVSEDFVIRKAQRGTLKMPSSADASFPVQASKIPYSPQQKQYTNMHNDAGPKPLSLFHDLSDSNILFHSNNHERLILPRRWNNDQLVAWLQKKHMIPPERKQSIPKDINGNMVMRMSKMELMDAFYNDKNNNSEENVQSKQKADILFQSLRVETDRVARLQFKRRIAQAKPTLIRCNFK